MARFAIFRLRDSYQERFRWSPKATSSPPAGEVIPLKPAEYRDDGEIEASSPYAAWEQARLSGREVRVGDVVADVEAEAVWICKFNGFEPAQWALAELSDGRQASDASGDTVLEDRASDAAGAAQEQLS